ncbi:alpha/beta hydrolase [Streptomyces antimycoticus]|uniref:alpha/beta hydrolase n=1 Tax=Streptomyces antimycoticus TaxID=68175 RepID=UPI001F34B221|nr:alpha/beta hydrolase [Streptomyces antimycoticus]
MAPALPSCGEAGLPGGVGGPGLPEDVAAVRQVLRAGDEPSVVAHSYGGIVTAEAAAGVGSVRHLLLVSSYLPEAGQSLSDSADGSPAPFLEVDPDAGAFGVRPELLVDTFLQDCAPEVRRRRTTSPGRACGGPGSRSRGCRMAAGALDVPRLRPGPGHPAAAAAGVRPPGRRRRRARRRPPLVPVSA